MATVAPLIVITGPTASGKSSLALELAERYGGEIICADSRTIYKGMDIGTAKPTAEERARVPHHLLDVVEPGERFTVHDFQTLASVAIADIRQRGKVPFLVGGTGLYIDSVVLAYQFTPDDPDRRQVLNEKSIEELSTMIKKQRLSIPFNSTNKRHLIQVLMNNGAASVARSAPDDGTVVVAITTQKQVLTERIKKRVQTMFAGGIIKEAQELAKRYGWDSEAMTGNVYAIIHEYLECDVSLPEAMEKATTRDRQLAKRQITWLKRHDYVRWHSLPEARQYLESLLSSRP